MGAKVDVATTRELNKLSSRIKQQDKELNTLHQKMQQGCTKKIAELEAQVKTLQALGEEVRTLLASHHTIMQGHEQSIGQVRKGKK